MKSTTFAVTTVGVATIVLAMVIGPIFSHPAYGSIRHSTSELAGTNMPNAWIMRTGFAAFGGGTAISALSMIRRNPLRSLALLVFGLSMVAAAIWPHDPILPELGSNAADDRAHSIAASTAGMTFTVAVLADLAQQRFPRHDRLGWLALAASLLLPPLMLALPATAGLWQRLMFGISFLWVLRVASTAH
jgi:Protein of unknown function (DUF998)